MKQEDEVVIIVMVAPYLNDSVMQTLSLKLPSQCIQHCYIKLIETA